MATRLLQACLTLWAVSIVIFLIPRVTGNAADALLPVEATAEQREILIENLGLNRPLIVQYGTFMGDILTLDFGTSFRNKLPVRGMLGERLVNSFYLGTASLVVAIALAVPLGTIAALNRGTVMGPLHHDDTHSGAVDALLLGRYPAHPPVQHIPGLAAGPVPRHRGLEGLSDAVDQPRLDHQRGGYPPGQVQHAGGSWAPST